MAVHFLPHVPGTFPDGTTFTLLATRRNIPDTTTLDTTHPTWSAPEATATTNPKPDGTAPRARTLTAGHEAWERAQDAIAQRNWPRLRHELEEHSFVDAPEVARARRQTRAGLAERGDL